MIELEFWKDRVNSLGKQRIPFLFLIDYCLNKTYCCPLNDLPDTIKYSFHSKQESRSCLQLYPESISFSEFKKGYDIVQQHLKRGDSYLVNYTVETPLKNRDNLRTIYTSAQAPYKLLFEDKFVVFSPETFVKISSQGIISTHPMKGTIDAKINNAEQILLSDVKESAEHATVVDLLRNDLSRVGKNVEVKKYRYIQKIKTSSTELLQASSEIHAFVGEDWNERIADILLEMLPAGSVTGAPKPKTLQIIHKAENHNRGFYTGVFGIFDGENLDSAVMIRFIENRNGKLYYKSGGGITALSKIEDEYNEINQKIYVPVG